MATTETLSEEREETHDERCARLDREKDALKSSGAAGSLRERLLALLAGTQHADLDNRDGVSHERALMRYAAATTKAVAMALQGTDYVCDNEPFDTQFTTEEAAYVLGGVSALLDQGPELIDSLRCADGAFRFTRPEVPS